MKKIFIIVLMAITGLTASAQIEQAFRMGVRINGGASDVTVEESSMSFGFGAGWIAEYNFSSTLFLQSGIGIENIGYEKENVGTLRACFMQVPIHVGYRFYVRDTYSLFAQAGPTIGVGLLGSDIYDNSGNVEDYFETANRFDLGLGARVGVEFSKYQVSAGFNYGITEANANEGGHNLSINLGVAYMF